MQITSSQNQLIKKLHALEKSKERKLNEQFTFEGLKELSLALESDYVITHVFYCSQLISLEQVKSIVKTEKIELVDLSKELFNGLVYRKDIPNIVALANQKSHLVEQIKLRENALILVMESVEKPGNIGAMLRTADAAGIDAVFIANPKTDLYNPNIIRSSVGCVFTTQIAIGSSEEMLNYLTQNNFNIFTTYLFTDTLYYQSNFREKTALVFGSEDHGVSDIWLREETQKIKIPMLGKIDSMNVSNSAAILLFEAIRQRQ